MNRSLSRPPKEEQFLVLDWRGPYRVNSHGQVVESQFSRLPTQVMGPVPTTPGVYMLLGDHHVHGPSALLYIGRSEKIIDRVPGHESVLKAQWNPEVYVACVDQVDLLDDVESLLIYAHSPAYNANKVATLNLRGALRIWNIGSFLRLLPEVSSQHPWYLEGQRSRP